MYVCFNNTIICMTISTVLLLQTWLPTAFSRYSEVQGFRKLLALSFSDITNHNACYKFITTGSLKAPKF